MPEEPSPSSLYGLTLPATPSKLIDSISSHPHITRSAAMACKGSAERKQLFFPAPGSENCNPNLSNGPSCKRKIGCSKSSWTVNDQSNEASKNDSTGQISADSILISPPRKHMCSSKRCASKNPDYAVPVSLNPKKFLVSKRRALQTQDASMCKCRVGKSREAYSTVDDQIDRRKACNYRCYHGPELRRWSSDDYEPRQIFQAPEKQEAFSLRGSGESREPGEPLSFLVAVSPTETAHQEGLLDDPKSCNRPGMRLGMRLSFRSNTSEINHPNNEYRLLQHVNSPLPAQVPDCLTNSLNRHSLANSVVNESEVETTLLTDGERHSLYDEVCQSEGRCFQAAKQKFQGDLDTRYTLNEMVDEGDGLMREEEEASFSPSPEKTGNWRLNAVLASFGKLSPTREGRVKTLVRAFESLMSFRENTGEQQASKPRKFPLQFSYLNSDVNGESENSHPEGGGNLMGDGQDDEEQEIGQKWLRQENSEDLEEVDVGNSWQNEEPEHVDVPSVQECAEGEEQGNLWQIEKAEQVDVQSVQEDLEVGKEGNPLQNDEVEHADVQPAREDEKQGTPWQNEKPVHDGVHSVREAEEQGQLEPEEERARVPRLEKMVEVERSGKKHWKEQEEEQLSQSIGVDDKEEEVGIRSQKQEEKPTSHQSNMIDEEAGEDKQQPVPAESTKVLVRKKQAGDQGKVPCASLMQFGNFFTAESIEEKNGFQKPCLQKAKDRESALGKKPISATTANCKRLQGSRRLSLTTTRPPLAQRPQAQATQDKSRISKPQPFKLLTEARGHMKEQEFLNKLKRFLEEEEKLRVPLAQGLPWTTDEPEIPHKPPAKENTKPLDIHLNSDLRAMERAEFDRFIAEKLLYLEERRSEEERLRRIAEEEEVKKMRQEMVPKAQLMPYFDRPFRPRRSSKRPTIPKEPQFHHSYNKQSKRQKCVPNSTS